MEMDAQNDESETEWPDVDISPSHADEYDQTDASHWLTDWAGKPATQQSLDSPKPPAPLAPLWTGYQPKVPPTGDVSTRCNTSGEPWLDGLADAGVSRDSSTTPLYPKDSGFLGAAAHDGGEQYASMGFETQGQLPPPAADADAQHLYFANLDDIFQQCSPVAGGNLTGVVPVTGTTTFPTTVSMLTPVSPANPGDKDPALGALTGDKNPSCKTADTLSHSVSINFSCSTGQLSSVMSLLASTGLPVNMKIDTDYTHDRERPG